eukprot:gnl/TRDRNA2_/TRDRNA2_67224_c0_seq1.p1 gnl/TRDRNA2_/TRDRNA2_67224_c0~~gnl/TRDRNA2_/TRDRNA2_67224_c0_seq1.p1  ORF type:complete len:218 (+),score=31.82 gnl/TRDRNA2_/TRDRNA2_67224_c0_seq1:63-716(+)
MAAEIRPPSASDTPRSSRALIAAARQRGNPIIDCVRSTPVEFVEGLVPDYQAASDIAVLFISLRFQRLHPDYLKRRADSLGSTRYRSRILLCRVDLDHPEETLEQITLLAFHCELSLLLAWTDVEAAAYLETLHRYQSKSAEVLMGRVAEGDHRSRLSEVLTTIRGINKTDASSLSIRFGSLAGIAKASDEELLQCPGVGDTKVKQLHRVFHAPFFS